MWPGAWTASLTSQACGSTCTAAPTIRARLRHRRPASLKRWPAWLSSTRSAPTPPATSSCAAAGARSAWPHRVAPGSAEAQRVTPHTHRPCPSTTPQTGHQARCCSAVQHCRRAQQRRPARLVDRGPRSTALLPPLAPHMPSRALPRSACPAGWKRLPLTPVLVTWTACVRSLPAPPRGAPSSAFLTTSFLLAERHCLLGRQV